VITYIQVAFAVRLDNFLQMRETQTAHSALVASLEVRTMVHPAENVTLVGLVSLLVQKYASKLAAQAALLVNSAALGSPTALIVLKEPFQMAMQSNVVQQAADQGSMRQKDPRMPEVPVKTAQLASTPTKVAMPLVREAGVCLGTTPHQEQ
jgi:hypothetical protein